MQTPGDDQPKFIDVGQHQSNEQVNQQPQNFDNRGLSQSQTIQPYSQQEQQQQQQQQHYQQSQNLVQPQIGIPVMFNQQQQQQSQQNSNTVFPYQANHIKEPVEIICPQCRTKCLTRINYEYGAGTFAMSYLLFIIFNIFCCWIPYFVNDCQDIIHTCPFCNVEVGIHPYSMC